MEHGQVSPGRLVVIRLDPGDDLLRSLQKVCEERGLRHGVIVAGYGALRKVRYHAITGTDYPPQDRQAEQEMPLELVSLQGIIADGNIHAHIGVSTLEKAFGGHLEPGTEVAYLAEIAILEVAQGELKRGKHPKLNTDYLHIKSSRAAAPEEAR